MSRILTMIAIGLVLAGCASQDRKAWTSKNLWEAIEREQRAAANERNSP